MLVYELRTEDGRSADDEPVKELWNRRLGLRGAGSMVLVLTFLYLVHFLAPVVIYPPARLGALIRDKAPGELATQAIERAVRLSNETGLEMLEHAPLAALSVFSHAIWIASGAICALVIGAGTTPALRARRGRGAAILMFVFTLLLAVGSPEPVGALPALSFAAASIAFARLAGGGPLFRISIPRVRASETPLDAVRRSRRRFLRRAGAALAGLIGGASLARYLARPDPSESVQIRSPDERFIPPRPDPAFEKVVGLSPEITPVEDFYNVDINISKPALDHKSWKLEIKGMVQRPFGIDFRQLQTEFSVVEMAATLSCISNEVGGDLVSTAIWRGVRLKEVLEAAQVRPGASELIFRAADGYSDSVPLDQGLDDDTLIAFGMNGRALPRDHGFPARMVIPGLYGVKNVKWLTSIEVSRDNYRGYWQQRGWSDVATVKTQSRIDVPASGVTVAADGAIAGVAWAGDRGISRVEVSRDNGRTWHPAVLKRELAPNAWRLWTTRWRKDKHRQKLLVRAVDGTGRVQESRRTRTHPSGASGLHSVSVQVKS